VELRKNASRSSKATFLKKGEERNNRPLPAPASKRGRGGKGKSPGEIKSP